MNNSKTSVLSNGLIWFGAAVSIAEILTGTIIAPLGFKNGLIAIVTGHVIGCVLLYLAGIIGAKTQRSAMDTVKLSFGEKGAVFFSVLNIVQLVGWTAVMIIGGAGAVAVITPGAGTVGWCVVIGALIILWVMVGIKNLGKLNIFAMGALFILTIVLSFVIFKNGIPATVIGTMSFGAAVELSVAMPLSWLPLISDYTKDAKDGKKATAASSIVYFFTSCWMYVIGLGAALATGESDIAVILLSAGLGAAAVVIIIFSTVTTTFLDVYSAGVSFFSITEKFKEKSVAIVVCIIGVIFAVFTPITQFENFLYLIGSVFAPMIAIMITDFFILKKDSHTKSYDRVNLVIWVVGFIIYRIFMGIDTPLGSTLPVMVATGAICVIANKIINGRSGNNAG